VSAWPRQSGLHPGPTDPEDAAPTRQASLPVREPGSGAISWCAAPVCGALALLLAGGPAGAATPEAPLRGVHTVILVRHGAYAEGARADTDLGPGLVPLGQRQAALVAGRLALLPRRPDALRTSPMTRARQTADVIGAALGLEIEVAPDLRECLPPRREPAPAEKAAEVAACAAQLERAYRQWLGPTPDRDSTDVLVAHGGVIRWLVCRALGIAPENWAAFGISHTGVTVVEVAADGSERVISFNDVGHLPPDLQTRGGTTPQPPGGLPAEPVR
jgi:serine/threonine-protein phosphatase PGAM5